MYNYPQKTEDTRRDATKNVVATPLRGNMLSIMHIAEELLIGF
jgi:hypothetical protein